MNDLYITRFSSWAPPADGGNIFASPDLAFTDPMFRRRLSQISKMTIQVVHDLLPVDENTKLFFLSFRGEVAKQYSVNKMVIEDKSVMPAAFSLSVFNAPIALACMALGLKGGYCAIYPEVGNFASGLAAAKASLLTALNDELVVVYADEAVPSEYSAITTDSPSPFAFGFILKKTKQDGFVPLSSVYKEKISPHDFYNELTSNRTKNVSA